MLNAPTVHALVDGVHLLMHGFLMIMTIMNPAIPIRGHGLSKLGRNIHRRVLNRLPPERRHRLRQQTIPLCMYYLLPQPLLQLSFRPSHIPHQLFKPHSQIPQLTPSTFSSRKSESHNSDFYKVHYYFTHPFHPHDTLTSTKIFPPNNHKVHI